MRNRYIVTYDISDSKRLARVFKTMKGYGEHIQYSVFLCDLSQKDQIILKTELDRIINFDDDQILFVNLGNFNKDWTPIIETLGRDFTFPEKRRVFI